MRTTRISISFHDICVGPCSGQYLVLWSVQHQQLVLPTLLVFLPAAYYRGAMGILLVYDVTDEASFNNIRNWMRNIEQHASDNVNKVSAG